MNLRKKLLLNSVLIGCLLALSGCGDFFTKKVKNDNLESSQFKVDCELNIDRFTKIMSEDIGQDIQCLGENLNLFIRAAENIKPGTMSRAALEEFIHKNRPDIKPEIVNALKAVYDLNHIITGDDPNFISKDNVDKVIGLLLVFNREGYTHFAPGFENTEKISYPHYKVFRDQVSTASKTLSKKLLEIYKRDRPGKPHKLNIVSLIDSFVPFTSPGIAKFKEALFVKRVFLGGDSNILTHVELQVMIETMDRMVPMILDILQWKHVMFQQNELMDWLKTDLDTLNSIVFSKKTNRDKEILFTIDEFMNVLKTFLDIKNVNVDKLRPLAVQSKLVFMGGEENLVRGRDLKKLADHGARILEMGSFFDDLWNRLKPQLQRPEPVTLDFKPFQAQYPTHLEDLKTFERIVKNYRFMKGKFESPFYTQEYRRSTEAIFEVGLLEYALRITFKYYNQGKETLDVNTVYNILDKFQDPLVELGVILPGRTAEISDVISLMGILFQYQSDNNNLLDVPEATEFAISLFSGITMTDKFFDYFESKDCKTDVYGRVEPGCFRREFFPAMCSNYRKYFPHLFEYLGASENCEEWEPGELAQEYLGVSISASRTCPMYSNREEIYYSKGDIMALLVELMHVETTMLRWDEPRFKGNNNNILDPKEVKSAYYIYEGAIEEILRQKPWYVKQFQYEIYKYLIKFEKVPDETQFGGQVQFVKFLAKFNKKAPATRKTMSSILNAVSMEKLKEREKPPVNPVPGAPAWKPPFDCDLLRDPERIPRN